MMVRSLAWLGKVSQYGGPRVALTCLRLVRASRHRRRFPTACTQWRAVKGQLRLGQQTRQLNINNCDPVKSRP